MSVERLLPIVVILFLVSCAAAGAPPPTSSVGVDASGPQYGGAPSADKLLPTPTPATVVAPTETPLLGNLLASAQADFDCDGRADRLQFFARLPGGPRDAMILARLTLATAAVHETTLGSTAVAEPQRHRGQRCVRNAGRPRSVLGALVRECEARRLTLYGS